jgi:arabinose-5-phosphate isomerase
MKNIKQIEVEAITNMPISSDADLEAIEHFEISVRDSLMNKGKVITTGIGKAGLVAKYAAGIFTSIGVPSVYLHPTEALHGDFGIICDYDTLLMFSNSGETDEVISLVKRLDEYKPHVCTLLITSKKHTPLWEMADKVLFTGNPKETDLWELVPTTSVTVMIVWCHILLNEIAGYIENPRATFHKNHHGGYLGEKSK